MTPKFDCDVYTQYYLDQAYSGIGCSSLHTYQKGYGIGSFLGGLFRCTFPLLKKSSAAVGSEILKSGANVFSDISRNENPKASIKKRGKEAIANLGKKIGEQMFGAGYAAELKQKRIHSQSKSLAGKKRKSAPKNRSSNKKINKAKRSKSDIQDIFTKRK